MNPPIRPKQEEAVQELLPCPGKRLQLAREAQNLDVASVADQLHLSKATVEALEAEDFDKLPARVFVRGYYRNYARLVGVNEETINREFIERCPDDECQGTLPATKQVRREVRSNHGIVRAVTWSLVVLLVVLIGLWIMKNVDWPENVPGPAGESVTPESELQPQTDTPALMLPNDDTVSQPREGTVELEPIAETPVADSGNGVGESPLDTERGLAEDTVVQEARVHQPAPEAIVQPEPKPKGEVRISFDGDCWVDIRDSTRQFKLVGTMRAGDSRVLGGRAPFSIILGNYKAASMSIDGHAYDLSVHADGKTAKFKLDPAALSIN